MCFEKPSVNQDCVGYAPVFGDYVSIRDKGLSRDADELYFDLGLDLLEIYLKKQQKRITPGKPNYLRKPVIWRVTVQAKAQAQVVC